MAEKRRFPGPPIDTVGPKACNEGPGPNVIQGKDPKQNHPRTKNTLKTFLLVLTSLGLIFLVVSYSLTNIIETKSSLKANGPRESNTNHRPHQAVNYKTGASETLRKDNQKQQEMELPVLLTFTNVKENPNLREKLKLCISSMFRHSSVELTLLIIGDAYSQEVAASIIKTAAEEVSNKVTYKLVALDVDSLTGNLHNIVHSMQKFFSYKPGAYYSQALFYLSLAIHRVMPSTLRKVIMLDADLKFETDIAQLFGLFDRFTDNNIIGIAREMQPVYRHIFHIYRHENPGTRVGSPPPDGLTGFNSGVMLLDIERMRKSELYNRHLDPDIVHNLTEKYKFRGHLGDQDFFTLLSLEHEELFYILPCSWNRQLCQWWRDKGYEDVFEDYFQCKGKVNIYHGNCNTPIPL